MTTPFFSIILPVYNGEKYLHQSLGALKKQTCSDFELLIIDDASDDASSAICKQYKPDQLLKNSKRRDHLYCRNKAAKVAKGKVFVFTDADVVFAPDTLEKLFNHFQNENAECVLGLYSLDHPNTNCSSLYKNTWIRYTYLSSSTQVDWFFSAIGAMRKDIWLLGGGFGEDFVRTTGGGDIALGKKLFNKSITIELDKSLEVVHLKRYSLLDLLRNDFNRSSGYSQLGLRSGEPWYLFFQHGFANIGWPFVVSTLLSWLLVMLAVRLLFLFQFSLPFCGLFLLYWVINVPFLFYCSKHYSLLTVIQFAGILFLDHLFSGLGVAKGVTSQLFNTIVRKQKK
ncbi:MAG: glycosyltransferase [bacterium]